MHFNLCGARWAGRGSGECAGPGWRAWRPGAPAGPRFGVSWRERGRRRVASARVGAARTSQCGRARAQCRRQAGRATESTPAPHTPADFWPGARARPFSAKCAPLTNTVARSLESQSRREIIRSFASSATQIEPFPTIRGSPTTSSPLSLIPCQTGLAIFVACPSFVLPTTNRHHRAGAARNANRYHLYIILFGTNNNIKFHDGFPTQGTQGIRGRGGNRAQ